MTFFSQDIKFLSGVGPKKRDILAREAGIETFGDLIEYYPYKYIDRSRIYAIREMCGEMPYVQIRGSILSWEVYDTGKRQKRYVAHFNDGTGTVDLVWFKGGEYAYKTYSVGTTYIVFGKPSVYMGRYQFSHPDIDAADSLVLSEMGLQPHYLTTEKMKAAGLNSRGMERLTKALVARMPAVDETLPPFITAPLSLIPRDEALRRIHYPRNNEEMAAAQKRLKFEELFFVQLNIVRYVNRRHRMFSGCVFSTAGAPLHRFYNDNLHFPLTSAQQRVVREIFDDMRSGRQMNRLLQGDVGSGKTLVALLVMLIAVGNGYQAVIMAPTEILAEQHLATISHFLKGMDINVALLTGMVKGKRRREVLEAAADGSLNILVGTHAVIEDTVVFKRLGLAVIDEQHRFGVAQRARLWKKASDTASAAVPHILVMTATPIPRTLAMTLYGDLDVSVIDELPPGRKPVHTIHRYDDQLAPLFANLRREIAKGRQAYIVYPLIKESEKMDLKDLEQGYEMLRSAFPDMRLSKVHGKMKSAEKEEEMQRFVRGETQILVATTVIEVGVNVPNASVMMIMEAQRFGLSQLHQLRGRVGRGADQSYCILVSSRELSEETRKRLDIMCDTNDGFRIAEADLKLRGPGDLEGTQQSGMAFDLKIANIARDGLLVQTARDMAQKVITNDPDADRPEYACLWQRLKQLKKTDIDWGSIS
ncbi:MAG: ATP-dependent DNA helicase RecG [Bacteroidales bacterium]|nr:ATP-dependent DNA helicase RecG [Bacteroidales bacterium]